MVGDKEFAMFSVTTWFISIDVYTSLWVVYAFLGWVLQEQVDSENSEQQFLYWPIKAQRNESRAVNKRPPDSSCVAIVYNAHMVVDTR